MVNLKQKIEKILSASIIEDEYAVGDDWGYGVVDFDVETATEKLLKLFKIERKQNVKTKSKKK